MTTYTPYQASKIINNLLDELGVEKILPPQMFYTYATKGYIETEMVDGKLRITEDGLKIWFPKYVLKNFKIDLNNTPSPEPSPEEVVMGA